MSSLPTDPHLLALHRRLDALERSRRTWKAVVLFGALGFVLATSGVALGQVTSVLPCGHGTSLFCFAPDAPALATEVNHNFEQVARWADRLYPDVNARLHANGGTNNVRVAFADSANFATSATSSTSASNASNADAVGGAKVYLKTGNNGSVSCRTFCNGSQWGRVGICIGALVTNNPTASNVDCNFVGAGNNVYCVCVEP